MLEGGCSKKQDVVLHSICKLTYKFALNCEENSFHRNVYSLGLLTVFYLEQRGRDQSCCRKETIQQEVLVWLAGS